MGPTFFKCFLFSKRLNDDDDDDEEEKEEDICM